MTASPSAITPGSIRATTLALLSLLTACGGGDSTAPKVASIRVVAGADGRDSIQATPPLVVVEVRGRDGALAPPGTVVQFSVPIGADPADVFTRPAFVCARTAATCGELGRLAPTAELSLSVPVDEDGRASARVRFGPIVGPTLLSISVPDLALSTTVVLTVRPGAADHLELMPRDTAVTVGATLGVSGFVADRFANSTGVAASVIGTSAGLRADGAAVTGLAVGRERVRFRGGAFADSLFIAVVPAGTLATTSASGVVILNTDGSGRRRLPLPVGTTLPSDGFAPAWLGTRLLLQASVAGDGTHLFVTDAAGNASRFLDATSGARIDSWSRATQSGTVYFQALAATDLGTANVIWSAAADGSRAAPVRQAGGAFAIGTLPGPTPDGSAVAYVASALNVLPIGGTARSLGRTGLAPRYSPDGSQLAFVSNGDVYVMNADGSAFRRVSATPSYFDRAIDWSPDGRWLIGQQGVERARLEVIDVATGTSVALPATVGLTQPAWKP